jgi:hypothetical protein
MPEKITFQLNAEEAAQLVKIINIAVKQVGLEDGGETANNGVYFLNKINNAFAEKQNGVEMN